MGSLLVLSEKIDSLGSGSIYKHLNEHYKPPLFVQDNSTVVLVASMSQGMSNKFHQETW